MPVAKLQRWSTYLSGFDYEFSYISSISNLVDTMSNKPIYSNGGNQLEVSEPC